MFGSKLRLIARTSADKKRGKSAACALDLLAMPGAGNERGFFSPIILTGKRDERGLQNIQALAGLGRYCDDAFYYFGLETGRVDLPGYRLEFRRQPMSVLNRAAREGRYEVTAISSVLYPHIAERYAVLSVGTSVGRGYGPVLVSKRWRSPEELRGRTVGVGGT